MFTSKSLSRIVTVTIIFMLAFSNVQPAYAAPDNDNFADAIVIPSDSTLPISFVADNTGATFEEGEPDPECAYGAPFKTVWYSYTPTENTRLSAFVEGGLITVYTGGTLLGLSKVGYQAFCDLVTFETQAHTTYYFQLSRWYGEEGSLGFSLDLTPDPQVYSFEFYPEYPSLYDDPVAVRANVDDPGGVWGESYLWTLWDGTNAWGDYDSTLLLHFTEDGDYPLSVTWTTWDGRSATGSTIFEVRTRDIGITKVSTAQVARSNQTKAITVEVTNRRLYADNVQVELYKGLPGGSEELVGSLSLYVPAGAKRPALFRFSYTFTAADAAIGKVTFRAVANIVDGRDALPADNTAYRTVIVK